MPRTRHVPSSGLLLVLASALAACGSTATTPANQQQSEQAACTAIAALAVEVGKVQALDPATATVADVQREEAAINAAWTAARTSVQAIGSADKAAVLAAGQAFETTVGAMSPGTSAADQVATIRGAIVPLQATYQEMQDGLGCAGAAGSPGAAPTGSPGASPSSNKGDY
jgi:hypothetical protein